MQYLALLLRSYATKVAEFHVATGQRTGAFLAVMEPCPRRPLPPVSP